MMPSIRSCSEARMTGSWRNGSSGRISTGSGSQSCQRHNSFSSDSTDSGYGDMPAAFCGRSTGRSDRMTRKDYEELENLLMKHFDKKFSFAPPLQDWKLPEPSEMFVAERWKEAGLQILKDELNSVKSKLDSYNLNDWHRHTRAMNKAGEIQWRLRKELEPEFLTQAWCKFYENARSFILVPPTVVNTQCLNSVHLCEAPGAFITSLNHFLKLHNPGIEWQWLATTLNPYYEGNPLSCMINDDRFILQTLSHWNFGLDYTGNLMDLNNMLHLVQEAAKIGDILLVTADGSIDCQQDPGEQESLVSSLHYCETVAALHILAQGGSFLLKMFTMYEHETVCLMYMLCCAFNRVHVFKPATSKEGNSEVYVVCLEYKGRGVMEPWLAVLRKHYVYKIGAKYLSSGCLEGTSGTAHPVTDYHFPEELNLQRHCCENLISLVQMSCISTLPDWVSLVLKEWDVCLLTMYMSSIASTGPELPDKAVFPQASIPQNFLNQLYMCASMFKDLQTDVIETNIRVYKRGRNPNEDFKTKKLRYLIANHFMETYEMQRLPESDEVVGKSKLKKTMTLNMDPRAEDGSFADSRKKLMLKPLELLTILKEELHSMKVVWPFGDEVVKYLEFATCVEGFKIQIGQPVKTVHSSKFCLGRLLRIRNQVREIARKDFQHSPSYESDICCENAVASEPLDQESELSQWLRKAYPRTKLVILNYKEKLWTSMEGGNEEAERNAFWDIMDAIDNMWRDENLLLQGYPMLTQFNVGIVYMLCHLFDKVGFMKPVKQDFAVLFIGFRKWNPQMRKFLDEVDDTIEKLHSEGGNRTVLSLFPINMLCERYSSEGKTGEETREEPHNTQNGDGLSEKPEDHDNIFYKCVTEVNHLCVKEQVSDIITNILNRHGCSNM